MSAEAFSQGREKDMAINESLLSERVARAKYYQTERMPGTGDNDAVNAVLSTDFRGKLTEEKKRERNAYKTAMLRLMQQPQAAE
jgi:hypothetical protein